jgi:hypothetical protein
LVLQGEDRGNHGAVSPCTTHPRGEGLRGQGGVLPSVITDHRAVCYQGTKMDNLHTSTSNNLARRRWRQGRFPCAPALGRRYFVATQTDTSFASPPQRFGTSESRILIGGRPCLTAGRSSDRTITARAIRSRFLEGRIPVDCAYLGRHFQKMTFYSSTREADGATTVLLL